ncbi:MAG: hypothetical protein LC624_02975 [Halobacteriales archaeon]|nr:hypothetical protein [Halobacteriales archaeon]
MAVEILATTAGVAVLMGVLPRALFAVRQGRAEGLSQATAFALLLLTGMLAVYGAWLGHVAAFVANVAASGACLGFLVQAQRCESIAAERRAIAAKMRGVRPQRRVVARR